MKHVWKARLKEQWRKGQESWQRVEVTAHVITRMYHNMHPTLDWKDMKHGI